MKKYIWIFFGVALLTVIVLVVFVREEGEMKSPQATQELKDGDLNVKVVYGRPSKRGREIFGALVPYNMVWRTGANEATEFHSTKDLNFGGKELKAGDYSMWVLPTADKWTVYFNSVIPEWGVNEDGKPYRDETSDVLSVEAMPTTKEDITEMFTITPSKADSVYNLTFDWDKTRVVVPFKLK